MKLKLALLIFLLFQYSCNNLSTEDDGVTGKVVSIADGDTFTLLTRQNKQMKIRLFGIDCPEKKQDFGQVAKQKLSDLIFAREVRILEQDVDRYQRTVAVVYTDDGKCINEELLKEGLAWHYREYDKSPDWDILERKARKAKRGLWSKPNPIPPWEWRKR